MTATFETLQRLDAQLASKGHHPLTPWWHGQLERFYAHPTARTLIARVGRGGAKSHTSTKVSLNETLFGNWKVPPGERHLWAFVSLSKDEAAQRLTLIERFLSDLGITYDRKGDEIHLRDLPRGWRVMACQVGAVSGFRCVGRSIDEAAKMRNNDGANPAGEIAASTAAMMVTHPGARSLIISSPLGTLDYHAERFELGDTADQLTAHAASWEANPDGITEEQTKALEPSRRVWLREYAAIPQSQMGSAFDPELVAEAFRSPHPGCSFHQSIGVIDASSGGGDSFAYGIVGYLTPPLPEQFIEQRNIETGQVRLLDHRTREPLDLDPSVLCFHKVDAFEGRFKGQISAAEVIRQIAFEFRRWGIRTVVGDQRESFFITSEMAKHGLRFHELPWTNSNKVDAVRRVREHLGCRSIVFPERPKLKKELLSYSERITASGAITYGARGTGHDDEAALVMTAAMAELERLVPGSPLYVPSRRIILPGP